MEKLYREVRSLGYNNTLNLVKVTRGNRIYFKQHILERLNISDGEEFEVFVNVDNREILLKPFKK